MKQRITVEQLKELTPEQQGKLREWWKPQEFDVFVTTESEYPKVVGYFENNSILVCEFGRKWLPLNGCLPLLSIGQCLKLLQEIAQKHWFEDLYSRTEHKSEKDGGWEWSWCFGWGNYNEFEAQEFIDALWEAAKSIL